MEYCGEVKVMWVKIGIKVIENRVHRRTSQESVCISTGIPGTKYSWCKIAYLVLSLCLPILRPSGT